MKRDLGKYAALMCFFELQNVVFYLFYRSEMIQLRHVMYYVMLSHLSAGLLWLTTKRKKDDLMLLKGMLYVFLISGNFFMYGMILGNLSARNINRAAYFANQLYFFFLVLLCVVLWKGRKGIWISGTVVMLFALLNYHVYCFRGSVLSLSDINSVQTAWNVRDNYHILVNEETFLFVTGIICSMAVFSYGSRRLGVGQALFHRWKVVLCLLLPLWFIHSGIFLAVFQVSAIYYEAGNNNGYYYNTVLKYLEGRYAMSHPPEGYSAETIEQEMEPYIRPEMVEEKPNIVVIMNESFADFAVIRDSVEFSRSLMENLQWIREEALWGDVNVSVFGGNTANSEYEFLTNDSMMYYPAGSVPYSVYIEDEVQALPEYFNQLDYYTCAMHPYKASGWNRPSVYRSMGFQDTFFEEEFEDSMRIRDYVSDAADYEKVYRLLEEQEQPVFCFNVTMQNHGGYEAREDYGDRISVEGLNSEQIPETEAYLALAQESDRAIGDFLKHLKEFPEPTIVVFFGDHQPGVEDGFYEYLYGKDLSELSMEEKLRQYATPFFIWSNTGGKGQRIDPISLNYLSIVMLEAAGLPLTPYQSFLMEEMYPEYPVVTAVGVIDKYGEIYEREESDSEILLKYEQLIYGHIMERDETIQRIFDIQTVGGQP